MEHKRIGCHVMSDTERTIRFVREHSHELVDAINEVCDVAQAMLNQGTRILIADIVKDSKGNIVWGLYWGETNKGTLNNVVLTKHGFVSSADFNSGTFLWSYVMERFSDGWVEDCYNVHLPYDTSEINVAIELIEMRANA